MVENTRQVQTSDPFGRFDEAINDTSLYPTYQYERPESRQLEPLPQDRVPLFLSDYEQQYQDERYEEATPEYTFGSKRPKSRSSQIVTGVIAATAAAAIAGLVSIDATRSAIVNAKASLASLAPAGLGGTPEAAPAPPQRAATAAAPEPRLAAPEAQAVYRGRPAETAAAAAATSGKPMETANAQPSRDEISTVYQSALKGQVAAVAPMAQPTARRMEPDELAGLLKRAKNLLAVGDIAAARLLLERAADAQEAEAALMLATTYDPQVLGNQDLRSIKTDPALAKLWYQKAAALGSADARRRLSQIQN